MAAELITGGIGGGDDAAVAGRAGLSGTSGFRVQGEEWRGGRYGRRKAGRRRQRQAAWGWQDNGVQRGRTAEGS